VISAEVGADRLAGGLMVAPELTDGADVLTDCPSLAAEGGRSADCIESLGGLS
jgi:hypothetical protein